MSSLPARRVPRRPAFAAAALLSLAACAASGAAPKDGAPPPAGPYVRVLGTAQDGGLPQLGCRQEACVRARRDPRRRRLVTSVLLVDPRSGKRWLFDASPDLAQQVARCDGEPPRRPMAPGRPAPFDGLFLTHAHIGHYAGLVELGPEAYGSAPIATWVSSSMAAFLRDNGPWSLLVERGTLDLRILEPDLPVPLAADLTVIPRRVPHRDEFSDTLAFELRGPNAALLFLPDIDKWERWEVPVEDVLARVDHALIDGTFFDAGELPERSMDEIPHPFIVESLERFAPLPVGERGKLVFTHLNHSNPAADPDSDAAARVRRFGARIAREGQVFSL